MIVHERCKRCNGQVVEALDEYRQREQYCLQCGAREYPGQRAALTIEEEHALLRRFSIGAGDRLPLARPQQRRKLARAQVQMRLLDSDDP